MNNTEPINGEPRPVPPEPPEPPARPDPEPPVDGPAPPGENDVFWGFVDLGLFIFFALVGLLLGEAVLLVEKAVYRFPTPPVAALLLAQIVTYAVLFGGLKLEFQFGYGRPFWRSLGWVPMRLEPVRAAAAGVGTALAVLIAGSAIHLPEGPNPMKDLLLQGRESVVLLAIFGVGVAPLCEELAFRGFLQPLLVRRLGAWPGILIPAAAFGALHYSEYGNSWRHAVLLSGAGACFGLMRHISRSTKAAVLMHAAYNGVLFLLLAIALASERNLHP